MLFLHQTRRLGDILLESLFLNHYAIYLVTSLFGLPLVEPHPHLTHLPPYLFLLTPTPLRFLSLNQVLQIRPHTKYQVPRPRRSFLLIPVFPRLVRMVLDVVLHGRGVYQPWPGDHAREIDLTLAAARAESGVTEVDGIVEVGVGEVVEQLFYADFRVSIAYSRHTLELQDRSQE